MAKYHLRSDGTPGVCKARPGKCPLGERPHFESHDEARTAYEAQRGSAAPKPLAKPPTPWQSYKAAKAAHDAGDPLTKEQIDSMVAWATLMEDQLHAVTTDATHQAFLFSDIESELENKAELNSVDVLHNLRLIMLDHAKNEKKD